jgi:hypothetical protein
VTLTPRTLFIDCAERPAAQPRQSPPESAAGARLSGVGPSAGYTAPAEVMPPGRHIRSGSMVGGRKKSCRRVPLLVCFQIYTRLTGLKRNEPEGSSRLPIAALALTKQSFQARESVDAPKGDQAGDWPQAKSESPFF